MLSAVFLTLLVALCNWHDLDNMQPLAAVAPKDAPAPAGPPPPPAQPAPAPAKPAPPKPALPPAKPTDPTVVTVRSSGTTTTTRPQLNEGQKPSDTTLTVRTDEGGHVVSMEVTTTPKAAPAELKPYNKGGGHHPVAKKALEGAPNYDANKALAVPKAELDRLGIDHIDKLTPEQRKDTRIFQRAVNH